MEFCGEGVLQSCEIKLVRFVPLIVYGFCLLGWIKMVMDSVLSVNFQREGAVRRKDKVYIGCGAGFGGDRPIAALKLLQRVKKLDYLVLECLAERTLADCYQGMMQGGEGFDPNSMSFSFFLSYDDPQMTALCCL